jgi:ribonuclease P protein component
MQDFSFSKAGRLTSQRMIGELFSSGHSFYSSPFRVYWKPGSREKKGAVQIAISVPKKMFKHAVDRNRIRRKIREAYRKNRRILQEIGTHEKGLHFLLVFTLEEDMPYDQIEKSLVQTLKRLLSAYEKDF